MQQRGWFPCCSTELVERHAQNCYAFTPRHWSSLEAHTSPCTLRCTPLPCVPSWGNELSGWGGSPETSTWLCSTHCRYSRIWGLSLYSLLLPTPSHLAVSWFSFWIYVLNGSSDLPRTNLTLSFLIIVTMDYRLWTGSWEGTVPAENSSAHKHLLLNQCTSQTYIRPWSSEDPQLDGLASFQQETPRRESQFCPLPPFPPSFLHFPSTSLQDARRIMLL